MTIKNIYAPTYITSELLNTIKQILTNWKEEIDIHIIIVEDFNSASSTIDRIFRQIINPDITKRSNRNTKYFTK